MSDYYRVKRRDYDELCAQVLELMRVVAELRAKLDAEKAMNARLMAMDFRPALPTASPSLGPEKP